MRAAVVGGGIVGLFAAYYLRRSGADVVVFDPGVPGARSVHAAGILEPHRAYRTNTFAFLRRVARYLRSGTSTVRSVDGRWLVESLRQLGKPPWPGMQPALLSMADDSLAAYAALAAARNDFDYSPGGLLERYDDRAHFDEERRVAEASGSIAPVVVSEQERTLFFPGVPWVRTERLVARLLRELAGIEFARQRVDRVETDGRLSANGAEQRFDVTVVATGVTSRGLGLPLTAVRGYGWNLRTSTPVATATIAVDRGLALVPFADELKATGGWDFDLTSGLRHSTAILAEVRALVPDAQVVGFNHGWRPCSPDGLPLVARSGALVVANGGFRLGWSFAPALGQRAASLADGTASNDTFLARFSSHLSGERLAPLPRSVIAE